MIRFGIVNFRCRVFRLAIIILCLVRAQKYTFAQQSFALTENDKADITDDLNALPSGDENTNENRASTLFRKFMAVDGVVAASSYLDEGVSKMEVVSIDERGNETKQPIRNIVARLNGSDQDSWIIVGAHLDRVEIGAGAIDDWTGCVAVLNLFERLRRLDTRKHTFIFVCFAYEESGLWGSRSFVKRLEEHGHLDKVKAMVNLECLGVSHPHIWKNGSTPQLAKVAEEVAEEAGIAITNRTLQGVGADSVPFFNAGIPAITFDSLDAPNFGKIHSPLDQLASLSQDSGGEYFRMFEAFRFAYDYLQKLDAEPPSTLDRTLFLSFVPPLAYESFHPQLHSDTHDMASAFAGGPSLNARITPSDDENVFVVGSGDSADLIIVRDSHVWRLPISSLQSGVIPTRLSQ